MEDWIGEGGGVYGKGVAKIFLGILQFAIAISRQQRNEREKNESEREEISN